VRRATPAPADVEGDLLPATYPEMRADPDGEAPLTTPAPTSRLASARSSRTDLRIASISAVRIPCVWAGTAARLSPDFPQRR
jgi:hypothetical protein